MINQLKKRAADEIKPGILARWFATKKTIMEELEGEEGLVLLDIGGGDGFLSSNLCKRLPGLRITVLDLKREVLLVARERGLDTLCASAMELPIKYNCVDTILSLSVIEHVKEDDRVIREISRVLKKDGRLILTTPGQDGVSFPLLSKRKNERIQEGWGHVRKGYSLKELENLLKKADLFVRKTERYFNVLTRFFYRICFLSRIPLFNRSELFWLVIRLESYIKWGGHTHLVVAKKGK